MSMNQRLTNAEKRVKYQGIFYKTFKIRLTFIDPLTGFDLTEFEAWLEKTDDGSCKADESIEEMAQRRYGDVGVSIIRELL